MPQKKPVGLRRWRRGPRGQRAAKVAASSTLATALRSLEAERGKFVPAWAHPRGSAKRRAEYEGRRRVALQVLTQPPEGRLAWLVQFVRREPRLEEFAIAGEVLRDLTTVGARPGDLWWTSAGTTTAGVVIPEAPMRDPLPESVVRQLQTEIREGLRALLERGAWDLPRPQAVRFHRFPNRAERPGDVFEVHLPPELRLAEPTFALYWQADVRARVLHGVAALLLTCGARLRACKQCRAPFLKRKRGEYCSVECGQRFRDTKKQQRKRGGRQG